MINADQSVDAMVEYVQVVVERGLTCVRDGYLKERVVSCGREGAYKQ